MKNRPFSPIVNLFPTMLVSALVSVSFLISAVPVSAQIPAATGAPVSAEASAQESGSDRSTAQPLAFELRFLREVHPQPFSGRVYLFFAPGRQEPRLVATNWFAPQPFVSKDVENWQPGEPLRIRLDDPTLHRYGRPDPQRLKADHRVQALVRFNPLAPDPVHGPGNGLSDPADIRSEGVTQLQIGHTISERPYQESRWGKLLSVPSKRLSEFHGREVKLQGTVLLPESYYEQPDRRYPVIFTIPGFGGDHRRDPIAGPIVERNAEGVEFIRVLLDPKSPLGHHVFADSANNGPVGTALVKEFIPALDSRFRTVPEPEARFLTGHSSGGWSSLWLQVAYPETFGGVWSTAPDPVDFRDFQRINLYAPNANMFVDENGELRPLARRNGEVMILYRHFSEMEEVLGHGGQLGSFEAVFSPKMPNGLPRQLWNRETGAVDPQTAEAWKPYDIRLKLAENPELVEQLQGKLHVFMGDQDTFYLEGATKLLKRTLAERGSDAVVEIVPGRNHSDLLDPQLTSRIRREMTEAFLESQATPAR